MSRPALLEGHRTARVDEPEGPPFPMWTSGPERTRPVPTRASFRTHIPAPEQPAPALADLPRTRLCGRIWALRRALDELQAQADADGLGAIPGYGALKVSLIQHETALRKLDAKSPAKPFAAAVNDQ